MSDNIKKPDDISDELFALCMAVTAKRARTVIDHILQYGFITTEDLKNIYGYDHPPRAIRDVRENGIPIITFKVTSKTTGRKIAAYKFDNLNKIIAGRLGGRKAFSKQFKNNLIAKLGSRCSITNEIIEPRYLQIYHRIPYEVAGDDVQYDSLDSFMLLDASAQRAKSWTCENCTNFITIKDPDICRRCFWANPESYEHIAMRQERAIYIVWSGDEIKEYEEIKKESENDVKTVQNYIKDILKRRKKLKSNN